MGNKDSLFTKVVEESSGRYIKALEEVKKRTKKDLPYMTKEVKK